MTLRLGEENKVIAVRFPERLRGVPDAIALISADRKPGLLLRSISSAVPASGRAGMGTRRKYGHHPA